MTRTPPLVWGLLVTGVIGVSFAGAILQNPLSSIPPLMRASWRLQLTVLILLPMFIWQWRQIDDEVRSQMFQKRTIWIIIGSGIALGAHFGTWVASLDYTSLTHSLLFVTSHPLILICGIALLYRKPTNLEKIGVVIGLIGAMVTLIDYKQGGEVTIFGDFLAFIGAVTVVGYIVAGKVLRQWMPVFIYALPVTLIAALILIPASIIAGENTAALGWMESNLLGWFILLAFLAGILGHTGLNACLRWLSPLTISVAVTMEPMIGSFIGWFFFDSPIPGIWTWLGGPLLIVGVILVILGGDLAEKSTTSEEKPSQS